MSDSGLIDGLEGWLQPFLGGVRRAEGLKKVDVLAALKSLLDWDAMQLLDRLAPCGHQSTDGHAIGGGLWGRAALGLRAVAGNVWIKSTSGGWTR